SRLAGTLFLAFFAWYLISSFKTGSSESEEEDENEENKNYSIPVSVILVILGIAGLIFGGQLFVNNATTIAHKIGVSDKIIAITILAGGTSLPEFVSCIVAAIKGKGQLALGNIVGSNISNILLILGCAAAVRPLSFSGMSLVDLFAALIGAVIVSISAYTFSKDELDRTEGAIMLLCEAAYLVFLVSSVL
ncbi:MAG: sodium:calcium antiporter, partial [Bacteroidales bacterium]|nr:sodium:calcium antiporter [Bacteroidales bacterium]